MKPLLNLESRRHLWWHALIAINQQHWERAELILSALSPEPDPSLNKKIAAARWFLLWRRDGSTLAIEKITALNLDCQCLEADIIIAYLLTQIDIDRSLTGRATDKINALPDISNPHAFWFGHSLGH
ncbi:hypothetical protein CAter282_3063 [Collimonas arenae]|uniref:Uncharacterized protein n=1 Tax=Collimonas arenae TaxID=279058 RepID=A0A127QL52_9BURK|nr:hypothetical protein [Collimonas arenae]AMP10774.1 hypothetical protein CAter282_3063 [Collimonas arenae]